MTGEELKKLGILAKIEIKDAEVESYLKKLNSEIAIANAISELDTNGINPTTHVSELRNVWRDDIVKPASKETFDEMMKVAPETEGTFYKVEKILEA
ncbi:MAG: Asp-tRNA(Asn)/Glu-tRNA(Gln) amidotransferase subunit GatC [Elusimicrobia bacterium]|nr:Asp-tRNA(Asn)/Glu-tRNA(Gln) amidotransferase subunit GatC [Elusimicrobiota bacterium]